jgi:hypothetical protein
VGANWPLATVTLNSPIVLFHNDNARVLCRLDCKRRDFILSQVVCRGTGNEPFGGYFVVGEADLRRSRGSPRAPSPPRSFRKSAVLIQEHPRRSSEKRLFNNIISRNLEQERQTQWAELRHRARRPAGSKKQAEE